MLTRILRLLNTRRQTVEHAPDGHADLDSLYLARAVRVALHPEVYGDHPILPTDAVAAELNARSGGVAFPSSFHGKAQ